MKLTLMLMGAASLLIVGILGIYFSTGAVSMNLLDLKEIDIANLQLLSSRSPSWGSACWGRSFHFIPGRPTVTRGSYAVSMPTPGS